MRSVLNATLRFYWGACRAWRTAICVTYNGASKPRKLLKFMENSDEDFQPRPPRSHGSCFETALQLPPYLLVVRVNLTKPLCTRPSCTAYPTSLCPGGKDRSKTIPPGNVCNLRYHTRVHISIIEPVTSTHFDCATNPSGRMRTHEQWKVYACARQLRYAADYTHCTHFQFSPKSAVCQKCDSSANGLAGSGPPPAAHA